jgi:carbonic anhydrase
MGWSMRRTVSALETITLSQAPISLHLRAHPRWQREIVRSVAAASVPEGASMSNTDDLIANNTRYAESFDKADLPSPPARKLAVVACMDARLDVSGALGLQNGDAHVIRNAGGVITDDEIRSLAISQRLLGTEEIVLIHHTGCGMLTIRDDEFRDAIEHDTGIRPAWSAEAFSDLEGHVRQSIDQLKASPFIPHKDSIRGFVYEVESGRLREVS